MYANIEDYKNELIGQKIQCLTTCMGDYCIHFCEDYELTIDDHAAFWRVLKDNEIIASSYDFVLRTMDETFDDHDYLAPEVAKIYEEKADTEDELFYNEALSQHTENKLDILNDILRECTVQDITIKDGDLHLFFTGGVVIDIFKAYSESYEARAYSFLDFRKKKN